MPPDHSKALPIAEAFDSVQGEGRWVGTPMRFVRLAGCSVGKPISEDGPIPLSVLPILKTGKRAWQCCTYDGRLFACDTDFNLQKWEEYDDLLADTWQKHVCITGGEPLTHQAKLETFIDKAQGHGIMCHVETSGTILASSFMKERVWISVSPKRDFLPEMIMAADEVKLLVDVNFDLGKVPEVIKEHGVVYVQPVNEELEVNTTNLEMCKAVLRLMPLWHLSVQLHKYINVR